MYRQSILFTVVLLAALIFLAQAGPVGAAGYESSQGWLLKVDEAAGQIHLATNPFNPSQTVAISVNRWVMGQCQKRLETRGKAYDIWMDVLICPGSQLGCSYSYSFRAKG